MSTPHRATDEQWEIVEICREKGHTPWPTATCLLELRARVEALEEAENDRRFEQAKAIIDAEAPDPAPVTEPLRVATDEELRRIWELNFKPGAAGAFRAIYDLGRQHGASKAAPAVKDSLTAAPPPLRCPGAHTIAECGGPCEDDFRLCDCGLLQQLNPAQPPAASPAGDFMPSTALIHGGAQPAPTPAGSLVERLPEPSDELLEFWHQRAIAEYRDSCYEVPVSRSMALQAIAWCRQQLGPGAVEASR